MPTTVYHTLKPTGGDYTLISTWEAAQQRDLVTADEIEVLECYKGDYTASGGGVDFINDSVTIDGWTMDATRYAVIKTPISERHTGKPRTGFRMQNASGVLQFCIEVPTASTGFGVRIEGLEFDCAPGDRNKGLYIGSSGGTTTTTVVDSCIAYSGTRELFSFDFYNDKVIVINCISIQDDAGATSAAFGLKRMQSESVVYNCTGIVKNSNNTAFSLTNDASTRTWRLRNCLGQVSGTGRAFSDVSGFAGTIDIDYCASNDTSAVGTNSRTSQTFAFVDEVNNDYHLAVGDTGAKGYGAALHADSKYAFNHDIDRLFRGTVWDIGAHNFIQTVTKTLRASGGDYSLFSTWEASEQTDLTAARTIHKLEIYNDWPSGYAEGVGWDIDGWTTDEACYVHVTVPPGERHDGSLSSGFFVTTSSKWDAIVSRVNSIMEWLRFKPVHSTYTGCDFRNSLPLQVWANCIVDGNNQTDRYGHGITTANQSSSTENPRSPRFDAPSTINCLVYQWLGSYAGFGIANWSITGVVNCVAVECANGFKNAAGGDGWYANCVAYGCTTSFLNDGDGWGARMTNNAASDGATTTPPGTNPVTSNVAASDFVDAASNDYHISATSVLRDAGANFAREYDHPVLFDLLTRDIDGEVRDAATVWDIGFDEYVSTGGGGTTYNETFSLSTSHAVSKVAAATFNVTMTIDSNVGMSDTSTADMQGSIPVNVAHTTSASTTAQLLTAMGIGLQHALASDSISVLIADIGLAHSSQLSADGIIGIVGAMTIGMKSGMTASPLLDAIGTVNVGVAESLSGSVTQDAVANVNLPSSFAIAPAATLQTDALLNLAYTTAMSESAAVTTQATLPVGFVYTVTAASDRLVTGTLQIAAASGVGAEATVITGAIQVSFNLSTSHGLTLSALTDYLTSISTGAKVDLQADTETSYQLALIVGAAFGLAVSAISPRSDALVSRSLVVKAGDDDIVVTAGSSGVIVTSGTKKITLN